MTKGKAAREDPQSPKGPPIAPEEFRINEAYEVRQEEVLVVLKQKRISEVKAKIALEKASLKRMRLEEDMSRLYQGKVYDIKNHDEWEDALAVSPDNQDWEAIVIEHLLTSDEAWMEMMQAVYDAQQDEQSKRAVALSMQADVANLHEELGMMKNRGITRAALFFAMAPMRVEVAQALPVVTKTTPTDAVAKTPLDPGSTNPSG